MRSAEPLLSGRVRFGGNSPSLPVRPPVAALALIADAVIVTVVPAGPLFFTTMALS